MKRVLVTGLSGHIGRYCLPILLDKGYQVIGCGREEAAKFVPKQVEWQKIDLLDLAATQKMVRNVRPSHLLNLAWYTEHGKFYNSPINLRWVEVGTTLLRAFAESGGNRFVGAGTCAEYDWNYPLLSEATTPRQAGTPFGEFKNALFELSNTYASLSDISFAWGRVFFVYGPNELPSKLVTSVIHSLLKGASARCSLGTQIRDFSHVQDIAAAFVGLLESNSAGAFNIASGTSVKVSEIIETIGDIMERSDLIELGAVPMAENDPPEISADVRRLRDEIGIIPAFNLRGGLVDTINYYMKK